MSNSITYTSTDQLGNKLNKSVTDINANVSGTTLHEFARIANALTTNTLGTVSRVSKVGLDAEKLTPTLTLSPSSVSENYKHPVLNTAPYHFIIDINYDGDGELDCTAVDDHEFWTWKFVKDGDSIKLYAGTQAGGVYTDMSLIVTASETDKYNAASVTLTVTN